MKMIGAVMDSLVHRLDEVKEMMDSDVDEQTKAEFIVKLIHDIENECIINDMCEKYYG